MNFLKISSGKIIVFAGLIIIAYFILVFFDPKIFPCYIKPVVLEPVVFRPDMCRTCNFDLPFQMCVTVGAIAKHTFWSILLFILFLLVIPYLVSCSIFSLIKKNDV